MLRAMLTVKCQKQGRVENRMCLFSYTLTKLCDSSVCSHEMAELLEMHTGIDLLRRVANSAIDSH